MNAELSSHSGSIGERGKGQRQAAVAIAYQSFLRVGGAILLRTGIHGMEGVGELAEALIQLDQNPVQIAQSAL